MAKVRADKVREATDGHDGTWVAHPGPGAVALEEFDQDMPAPNQIDRKREDVHVTAADLLAFGPQEPITEAGLRTNINVGVQYLGAWLAGVGRGADLQPDGRRRHRRNLARPGLAVDPQPARAAWTTAAR